MTGEQFMDLALSLPGTGQITHFDRIGFCVTGKKMFATYLAKNNSANIFLSPAEQSVFCQMDPEHIYPVPNKWGEKGATTFDLEKISKEFVLEALLSAYNAIIRHKK